MPFARSRTRGLQNLRRMQKIALLLDAVPTPALEITQESLQCSTGRRLKSCFMILQKYNEKRRPFFVNVSASIQLFPHCPQHAGKGPLHETYDIHPACDHDRIFDPHFHDKRHDVFYVCSHGFVAADRGFRREQNARRKCQLFVLESLLHPLNNLRKCAWSIWRKGCYISAAQTIRQRKKKGENST